ncbi:malectin domain-containing carbohydrate-binding protein, partial [Pontibacter ramchanderi]
IHAEAGYARAVVKTFTGVSVTDGKLTIGFSSVTNNAIVSAIEVIKEDATTITSAVLTNSGGSSYKDSQSRTWAADAAFSGGVSGSQSISVSNTSSDALYQRYRYASNGAPFSYNIPVASGRYTVKLHFAEPYFKKSGARKFNVDVEGARKLSSYDIHAEAGYARAVVKTFTGVSVTDGKLTIGFSSVTNNAIVSAVEVIKE